ncbi:hypothetical protein DSECCO2_470100 [anaerobic digester metagenome]
MTCHIATDARECMLRHSHARYHREGVPCLGCSTGISRMSRAVEWPPATTAAVPEQSKRRVRPRKVQVAKAPAAAPAKAQVAPEQPKRRGRPRKIQVDQAPAAAPAPAPAPVAPDTVRQAVRDALHLAEACALGLGFLAERCGADAAQLREILTAEGMTIFKNEIAFQGEPQLCVSVNKRLRSWAA